jgi:hypothetical protein
VIYGEIKDKGKYERTKEGEGLGRKIKARRVRDLKER